VSGGTALACHGTAVLVETVGVLLRGGSGSGKSLLALKLIDAGARLIADDRVYLSPRGGRLLASPPSAIAGLIELRGAGILRRPCEPMAIIALIVDLVEPETVERMPSADGLRTELEGVTIARQAVPAPGSAGTLEPAVTLIRNAVANMRNRTHHKALHLTQVSP
jgi:serine kinase of HPr protein (carbohydrate metabolism regulator)